MINPSAKIKALLALLAVVFSQQLLPAPPPAGKEEKDLAAILEKMTQFGRNFRSLAADIRQRKYIAVIDEFEREEKGKLYYQRTSNGSARLRREIHEPAQQIATIDDGVAVIYEPALQQARRLRLGRHKDKTEFFALGIGQPPGKLQQVFNISLIGREALNGARAALLELVPKGREAGSLFARIILWIDENKGLPLQQKFVEHNGDFILVRFSNIKINVKMPDSLFKLKLSKDIEIIE